MVARAVVAGILAQGRAMRRTAMTRNVMAALPPALNIFVISTQYRVGVERASACILVGTIVSMVTLSGFLWLVKTGRIAADLFH